MSRNIPVAISVSKIKVDVGDKNFSAIQIFTDAYKRVILLHG